jgi:hypothetical protein
VLLLARVSESESEGQALPVASIDFWQNAAND